jgi:hypothetical protein
MHSIHDALELARVRHNELPGVGYGFVSTGTTNRLESATEATISPARAGWSEAVALDSALRILHLKPNLASASVMAAAQCANTGDDHAANPAGKHRFTETIMPVAGRRQQHHRAADHESGESDGAREPPEIAA